MAVLINIQLSAETLIGEVAQVKEAIIEMKSVLKDGQHGVHMWDKKALCTNPI